MAEPWAPLDEELLPHVVTLLRLVRFGLKEVTLASLCVCAELVPNFRDEFDALAGGDALFRELTSRRICKRKELLFRDEAAVTEWAHFLDAAIKTARIE